MENDLRNAFIKKRYKTVDELIALEKIMAKSEKKLLVKMPPDELTEEIKKNFDLIDIFYENLLALSMEERADFIIKHKKVSITRIRSTFDIDWKAARDIFQYLKLSNVGKMQRNYLIIEKPEKFKAILVNRLNKIV